MIVKIAWYILGFISGAITVIILACLMANDR